MKNKPSAIWRHIRTMWANKWARSAVLALPIIIYMLPVLLSGNLIASGDADYQFQFYEAFRRSLLEYHQLPWWNPWVSGGVPLFANAQFGPISLQAVLVLLFGSVMGIKLSFLFYLLIGFFGFYLLTRRVMKAPEVTAILLSYIWVFSSFSAYRISGHFTFILFHFLPLVLYLYYTRHDKKWQWLKLGLVLALMIWSSPHYSTIMTMLILGLFFIFDFTRQVIRDKLSSADWKATLKKLAIKDGSFWLKTGAVTLLLGGYRLYFALAYIHDFPRPGNAFSEPYFGIKNTLLSLFGPIQFGPQAPTPPIWSWMEASYAIGTPTLLVLLLIAFVTVKQKSKWRALFSYSPYVLGGLLTLFLLLAQGRFADFAPFALMQQLPILSSMRVAMRWVLPVSLVVLLLIAAYKGRRFRPAINGLLALSVLQLFISGTLFLKTAFLLEQQPVERAASAPFEQQLHWKAGRVQYDENLLGGTNNNYGQIIAADALVDTRLPNATVRCDVDEDCPFVLSRNAQVTYWSPNVITLRRTGEGPIRLNMNPGEGWAINGVYHFRHLRVTDPHGTMTISDKEPEVTLRYAPRFSPEWALMKIGVL